MLDPTNPFGNPCGFGLSLHVLGWRFWRYSQSPHGARTGAAERKAGAKRRPKFFDKDAFPDKSDQPGAVPKPGFASIRVKEAANQVPTPNESIFEEHGSRGV